MARTGSDRFSEPQETEPQASGSSIGRLHAIGGGNDEKAVRAAKDTWLDGPEAVERAVLGLSRTVALTAAGLATLRLVALDFVEDHARWQRHQKP